MAVVNRLNMDVFVPALVFAAMADKDLTGMIAALQPVAASFIATTASSFSVRGA